MAKNIIICLDGTGNEVKAKGSTNVLKLVELLDLTDPTVQVAYYDPGVGTFAAPAASSRPAQALSRLGGLALGHGLRQNLGEAYSYLMNTWDPGDQVYIFGFSRGAYTARALCGMLYRVGLLRKGSENLVPYAVKVYARRSGKDDDLKGPEGWKRIDRFAKAVAVRPVHPDSVAFPIAFLGLFDTVKATRFVRDFHWPYTDQLPNVAIVRHAVSIDEKRRPYRPALVPPPKSGHGPQVTETWFAGVHSDIGGGFDDTPGLGNLTMRWMVEGAIAHDLRIRTRLYHRRYPQHNASIEATCKPHRMGRYWAFATYQHRRVPPDAVLHASVGERMKRDAHYRKQLGNRTRWDNQAWLWARWSAVTA